MLLILLCVVVWEALYFSFFWCPAFWSKKSRGIWVWDDEDDHELVCILLQTLYTMFFMKEEITQCKAHTNFLYESLCKNPLKMVVCVYSGKTISQFSASFRME